MRRGRGLRNEWVINFCGIGDRVKVPGGDQKQLGSDALFFEPIQCPRWGVEKYFSAGSFEDVGVRIEQTTNKGLKLRHIEGKLRRGPCTRLAKWYLAIPLSIRCVLAA